MKNYNDSVGIPVGALCEPTSISQPLNERVSVLQGRLDKALHFAEELYSELYGPLPSRCEEDGNKPRYSLDEAIYRMNYKLTELEDCLSETLIRLRG